MVRQIQNLQRQNGTAIKLAVVVDKYELDAENLQVAYSLRDVNNEQIESNILTFDQSVINAWGSTNDAIWNAVANELGATFINNTEQ